MLNLIDQIVTLLMCCFLSAQAVSANGLWPAPVRSSWVAEDRKGLALACPFCKICD
jgi:hypothetical protein